MTKSQFNTIASLLKDCKSLRIVIDWYQLYNYHNRIEIDYKEGGLSTVNSEEQAKETIEYLRKQIDTHKIEHSQI